jgi:hypothetical protein
MTDSTGTPDFEPHPPEGAPFEEFTVWLERHQNQARDPTDHAPQREQKTQTSASYSAETRVFASTLPYGLFWVATAVIAAHLTSHHIDPTRHMAGLAMITWATSLACEFTRAYAMGNAYPTWGMWGWINHPATRRLAGTTQQAIVTAMNDGRLLTIAASVAIPASFVGFYLFSVVVGHATQLWTVSVLAATGLHIAAAARQVCAMWKQTA